MTMTRVFGSTSAKLLLRTGQILIPVQYASSRFNSNLNIFLCDTVLVIRTVTVTSPSSKEGAPLQRMQGHAVVLGDRCDVHWVTVQPSGRLVSTSYVKESSPLPLLLMEDAVVWPGCNTNRGCDIRRVESVRLRNFDIERNFVISPLSAENRMFVMSVFSHCSFNRWENDSCTQRRFERCVL